MSGEGRNIGFVGLGRMGTPMARRLVDAGFAVTGYDPAANAGSELQPLDAFFRAPTLEDVADRAATIILMLPDSNAVEDVIDHARTDRVSTIVDMSSSEPARTRELAQDLAAEGVTLLDAPVSGGVAGARRGSLTIMVGGPPEAFAALEPVLGTMGSKVIRVGDVGAGHAVKAINNLMSATHLLASSEALLTARAFGLDLDLVLDAVNTSTGRSGSTQVKWPEFVMPGSYDSGFAMQLMVKDMRIAKGLADGVGSPMPLSARSLALWEEAQLDLPTDADHTEIARWVEAMLGNRVAKESDGG